MKMNVYPVIHHAIDSLTRQSAELAFECGCPGVFIINMSGPDDAIWDVAKQISLMHPDREVGVNLLRAKSPSTALQETLDWGLDMLWLDNCGVRSDEITEEAIRCSDMLDSRPDFSFFGSVAFKYQRRDKDPGLAAQNALRMGFIPTTSGEGTGEAADEAKLAAIYARIGDTRWAVASGVTAENIKMHKKYCTDVLVSTGISESFNRFSREKLQALMKAAAE